jgi:hypothetical protein
LLIEEIRQEFRSFLEVNENKNTTYQNIWDTAKARNFIAMSAYNIWSERSQINDLMLNFKLLEKQEQTQPKISKRREIIKIRAKTNATESKKTYK